MQASTQDFSQPDRRTEGRDAADAPLFIHFLGGFECSTKVRADGRRLDLLASTGHAALFDEDYRILRRLGLSAARDGLRWHMVERAPGAPPPDPDLSRAF